MMRRGMALLACIVTVGSISIWAAPATQASPHAVKLTALAVDSCPSASAADWNTVKNASNLEGLGFYMGGATAIYGAAHCMVPGASWVNSLQGSWRLMPIWDDLQAPCTTNSQLMSSTPSVAFTQGQTSGDNASAKLAQLGLGPNSIAYLDVESYSGCEDAVKRYVAGFVSRMHANGNQAGLYGSSCSPDIDIYASISAPPDDIWGASQNGYADTVNISCLNQGYWIYQQRLHQYTGGAYLWWGGVKVYVDRDCDGGDVVGLVDYNPGC